MSTILRQRAWFLTVFEEAWLSPFFLPFFGPYIDGWELRIDHELRHDGQIHVFLVTLDAWNLLSLGDSEFFLMILHDSSWSFDSWKIRHSQWAGEALHWRTSVTNTFFFSASVGSHSSPCPLNPPFFGIEPMVSYGTHPSRLDGHHSTTIHNEKSPFKHLVLSIPRCASLSLPMVLGLWFAMEDGKSYTFGEEPTSFLSGRVVRSLAAPVLKTVFFTWLVDIDNSWCSIPAS